MSNRSEQGHTDAGFDGDLVPIPAIPDEIISAASEANLVIFVGAGVSRLVGFPSWEGLADNALEHLAHSKVISFGEIAQLSELDARTRLSIAMNLDKELDVRKLLSRDRRKESRIFEHLRSIGCAYVTTNYDLSLDRTIEPSNSASDGDNQTTSSGVPADILCRPHQFSTVRLRSPGAIIHLHGSMEDRGSMIVTASDYLRHYEEDAVKSFLRDLFEWHTVLFVGYGLKEWELLEHIFRKGTSETRRSMGMFLLAGYYSHQGALAKHLRDHYHKAYGVTQIPFSLDDQDYKQLERIIEDWSGRMIVGEPLVADDLAYVLEVARE